MSIQRTVLVITDSEQSGNDYKKQLQEDGKFVYRILTERYDAPGVAYPQPVDGVLLVLRSPDGGGLEVLGQWREALGACCPPIVVVGGDEVEVAVRAMKRGATEYRVKARLTPEGVRSVMGAAIAQAREQRTGHGCWESIQTWVETMVDCFGVFASIRDETGRIVDFRIDYLNSAACESNQMPRAQQVGRQLCEVLPGHRESGLFDAYCELVETGVPLVKDSLVYEDVYGGEQQLVRAFDVRAMKLNDGFVASWRDITDRKRLELRLSQAVSSLQRERGRLQRLIDTAPIGIGIGTTSGEVRIVNDAMLHLHGYTRAEFEQRGMNWREFVPPEAEQQTERAIAYLHQRGFLPLAEKTLRLREGGRVPVWISAMLWMDGSDEYVAFAVDLTQQKQTEAALRASQQRYRDLAEAMPAMVWTADATGAVNYWNQRWYEYTGLSAAESLGLGGVMVVHPEGRDRTLAEWSQAVTQGDPFEMEYRIRRWDGVYHWFICRAIPTHNETGEITGWVGSITNIDDQKRLEERFRLVTRAVNGLVFDWNLRTNCVDRSEKLWDLIGVHPEEVPLEASWWHDRIHPDDMARLQPQVETLFASPNGLCETEYRVRHAAGHWVDVWERSCLIRDEQGQVIRIVGSTVDVSDRRQAERDLRRSEERYRTLFESMNEGFCVVEVLFDAQERPVDYRFLELNPVFEQHTGLRSAVGKTVRELLPDLEQHWFEIYGRVALTGEAVRFENESEVMRRWFDVSAFRIGQPESRKVAILFKDITDRKQAERALQEAHIQLEAALAAGSIYTWRWDILANRVVTNRSFALLFGVDPEGAAIGLPIEDFLHGVHPDDFVSVSRAIERAIATGDGYQAEFRIRSADGQERWVIARGQVEYDAAGRAIAFPGALADISDRKQAEEALRQSEERLRLAMQGAQMGTWDVDLITGRAIWSDQHFTMLGYEPTPTGEASEHLWSSRIHPEDREWVAQEWQQSRQAHRLYRAEYRVIRADNQQVAWLAGLGRFTYNHQGEAVRSIGILFDISDRKQAEAALQESEERFRTLADNISQFAWMADASGWIFWYNRRWFEYTGTTLEQMQGWGWQQVHHPEHVERVVEHFRRCVTMGEAWEDIFPLRGQDGRYRWFLSRALPIRDEAGQILRWFGTNTDITERKWAEELLAANEARLRGFVEANVVGILYGDIYGNISQANDEFMRVVGYTREDLEAGRLRWNNITPPEYWAWDAQGIAEARKQGACTPYEKEFIRKDGSRVPVLIGYSLLGEAREEAVAFVLDVSDRKRAEAALRQSEDRLRIAIEAAQLGTWDWNLSTNTLIWDTGCKAMFGLPPDAATTIEVFYAGLHPDDRDRLEQVVQVSLDPSSDGNYDVEFRTIGIQDGIERWVAAKGQAYFDLMGTPLRFIGTVIDITERKRAEAEREQLLQREQAARESAERANRIKDEFLAVLSHELRSPLNPILGWAKLLQTHQLSDTKMAEALATIERNAKLQTQLIDDLLDVAKILRGKLSLTPTPVDLTFVIEAAIETVRTAAIAKSIVLHPVLLPIGRVSGDAARLQQVVWNLLSNAIKFTPAGGRVDIQLAAVAHQAEITVRDTGKGIHPNFLPHLFDSFRQEDASTTRKYGGLGLGLAIVRQLVEAHGGTIAADSQGPGQGAIFTVRLPLMQVEPEMPPLPEDLELMLDLTGVRVFVVDDEPDSRELVVVLLNQYGAEVLAVNSAAEVLARLASFQPDVLVSDIGMPDVDGYTLIQQIRALPPDVGGQVPAIALTAYARETDQQRALSSGYQLHVTKPLDPELLVQAVMQLVPTDNKSAR